MIEKIIKTYNTDKKKIIIIKGENTHKVYKIYLRGNKRLEHKNEIQLLEFLIGGRVQGWESEC